MDEPNLQCVPKPRDYKVLLTQGTQAPGSDTSNRSAHTMRTANLRGAFVAPPGFLLLSGVWWVINWVVDAANSGALSLQTVVCCMAVVPPQTCCPPPLRPSFLS
jgi:hypothetical protein